jgi:hypothetical protein
VTSPFRVLDACSGAGGATRGYQLAGAHVTGVDTRPQPNYCGDEFIQGDAVAFIHEHGRAFDFIHASPPCKAKTTLTLGNRKRDGWTDDHVDLINPIRAAIDETGVPGVMENVMSADNLRPDLVLCGLMFGLLSTRHRKFELCRWFTFAPPHVRHPSGRAGRMRGWNHGRKQDGVLIPFYGSGGGKGTVADAPAGLGIDWMTDLEHEVTQAIPPAYTRWIFEQWLDQRER